MQKLYTIGSSSHSLEEFLGLLTKYKIEALVDVRRFPTSKYEHFKKDNLSQLLKKAGIEYIYLGKELGGFRKGGYEAYMETQEYRNALDVLEDIAKNKILCLMCAEKNPHACHRRFISRSLEERGWEICNII